MRKLIEAEFYKIRKMPSFRLIFFCTLLIGIFRGFSSYSGYQVYSLGVFPEIFDAVLISVFTVAFIGTEYSNRTFGNGFFCGTSRQNVFFAKLVVYFPGLLILILSPLLVSTSVATLRHGFGADWDAVAMEITAKFLFYVLYRFSQAGFAVLVASVIQNSIGTLGISMAGLYLMVLAHNPVGNSVTQDTFMAAIVKTAVFLSAAALIFMRRDLK